MRLLFACVLMLIVLPASAVEQIPWLLPDFALASIPENGKPGNGISDELLKLIIARWPEVEHQFLRAKPSAPNSYVNDLPKAGLAKSA